MKIDLSVDQGPCNTDLRSWCLGIAIYFLISIIFTVFFVPSVLTFIGFAISLVANICLLIGCQKSSYKLVFVWLLYAVILAIGFPIAIFGCIFHFGGYREATGFNNVFLALFSYIIQILITAFCVRLVYSYYLQLKGSDSNPRSAAVV